MAQARNFGTEFRYRGLCTGIWVWCDVDFDQHEAAGVEALAFAGAAAVFALPPPANVVIAAIIGSYAAEIHGKRGSTGVSAHIEVLAHNPACNKVGISTRGLSRPAALSAVQQLQVGDRPGLCCAPEYC